jgi:hypothetical protein
MYVLANRFRRADAADLQDKAGSGASDQVLRTHGAVRVVCKWQNAAQGAVICKGRAIGPDKPAASR